MTRPAKATTFGERLRQARLDADMSHRGLALAAGVESFQMIRHWEMGTSEPALAVIEALAGALNVGACWLAFGDENR